MKKVTKEEMLQLFKEHVEYVNDFAMPTRCFDKNWNYKYSKTCTYPVDYLCTPELQDAALEYKKVQTKKALDAIQDGDLVLYPMGMEIRKEEMFNGDISNYRLRCRYFNKDGIKISGDVCRIVVAKEYAYISFDMGITTDQGTFCYYPPTSGSMPYTKDTLLSIINNDSAKEYKRVHILSCIVPYEEFDKLL